MNTLDTRKSVAHVIPILNQIECIIKPIKNP